VSFIKMSESNAEHLYTQRLYPTVNNEDLLEFRIPPNSRGHLDLSNVLLHFLAAAPVCTDKAIKLVGQSFFGPKQFSSVEIRVNGEAVSRRSCANEYFLGSMFQYNSNYSIDYQVSACRTVGIFDPLMVTSADIESLSASGKSGFTHARVNITGGTEYEILMPIDSSIFSLNELLPSNTAIDLSFERTTAKFASILFKTHAQADSHIELKDVYLTLPYKRSEEMFQRERNAISRPIKLRFDDYAIKRFNIPKGTKSVMMNNLISGPLPNKLFWGIQSMASYGGSFQNSSTRFNRNGVIKASLYCDGKESDDYPVSLSSANVAQPFVKYLENTNQQLNGFLSRTLCFEEFEKYTCIYSTSFDTSESGSLSFELDFQDVVDKDLVLITCSLFPRTMKIDQNRNFQII